jgi:GNAT superfamily N-acetyltransferase
MKFVIGCDLEEFKGYYLELATDTEWQNTFGFSAELGDLWERILSENPSQLIVFRENSEIIGHAIWHPTSTKEHRKGDPRDKEDTEILERLLGGEKDFVELHEIWLRKEHRGKGYGNKFFDFFEEFIKNQGYDSIIYYADHPAAVTICRKRGYEEEYGLKVREPSGDIRTYYVFCHLLKNMTERKVEIVDYDPTWPEMYGNEKTLILSVVGHIITAIEHVGSTAVPSLGAKPTIDIMVAVHRLSDAERCI